MCKITGKSIFCCGVGMQNIIFFLATNYYTVNLSKLGCECDQS
jgi:hypothetical protein